MNKYVIEAVKDEIDTLRATLSREGLKPVRRAQWERELKELEAFINHDVHEAVIKLIMEVRNANPIMVDVFTKGSCFNFFMMLRAVYPEAQAYYSQIEGHVITKIEEWYYDINGPVQLSKVIEHSYAPIDEIWAEGSPYNNSDTYYEADMYNPNTKPVYSPVDTPLIQSSIDSYLEKMSQENKKRLASMDSELVSNCCGKPVYPDVADEGTGCYVCMDCKEPCDAVNLEED